MSTGLEVAIEKGAETDAEVEYLFLVRVGRGGVVVPNPSGRAGRVVLLKASGDVFLREACPDDVHGGLIFSRVVGVLKRHWRAGEYPMVTLWAG